MKKLIILSFIAFLGSCTSDKPNVQEQIELIVKEKPHELELNNGKRWKVDEGMLLSYNLIVKELNDFKPKTVEDYHSLSGQVYSHLKSLINSCTMTGVAHEELHKWLHPFIESTLSLEKVKTKEEGEAIVKHLKHELVVFNAFFE